MTDGFMLGRDINDLRLLVDLFPKFDPRNTDPKWRCQSATLEGRPFVTITWWWPTLSIENTAVLRWFCPELQAPACIRTPIATTEDGQLTWKIFQCTMHWGAAFGAPHAVLVLFESLIELEGECQDPQHHLN